jgi:hypothetical protein
MPPISTKLEPLLVATLALMSALRRAEACPRMVAKVASNLAALGQSPGFSDEFHTVLVRLAGHWAGAASGPSALPAACPAVSNASPGQCVAVPESEAGTAVVWH